MNSNNNQKTDALFLISCIGGGFLGVSISIAEIFNNQLPLSQGMVFIIAILIYGYITYAGLLFANDRSNTKHLKIALLLQIPWFSSPVFVYTLTAGISLTGVISASGIKATWNMGSFFNMGLFTNDNWGIGINLAAIGLYWLLKCNMNNKSLS